MSQTHTVTVHFAESDWGKLAHRWSDTRIVTACGRPCAYHDGGRCKLATGWVQASTNTPRCPTCFSQ